MVCRSVYTQHHWQTLVCDEFTLCVRQLLLQDTNEAKRQGCGMAYPLSVKVGKEMILRFYSANL